MTHSLKKKEEEKRKRKKRKESKQTRNTYPLLFAKFVQILMNHICKIDHHSILVDDESFLAISAMNLSNISLNVALISLQKVVCFTDSFSLSFTPQLRPVSNHKTNHIPIATITKKLSRPSQFLFLVVSLSWDN